MFFWEEEEKKKKSRKKKNLIDGEVEILRKLVIGDELGVDLFMICHGGKRSDFFHTKTKERRIETFGGRTDRKVTQQRLCSRLQERNQSNGSTCHLFSVDRYGCR